MKRRPELESALRRFEKVCAEGGSPHLEEFAREAISVHELCELARADLQWRWQLGQRRLIADYLATYPEIVTDHRGLADLAFEEYRQRWNHGDPVPPENYRAEYGIDVAGWVAGASVCQEPTRRRPVEPELDLLAPTRRVAEQRMSVIAPSNLLGPLASPLPQPGEDFVGFHLVHELGRGAFGRVYLARQEGLAGRLVALKVSGDLLDESKYLARLQHTHIVPIYSLHRTGTLHAVCMPYFGCTTLADLCKSLGQSDGLPTSGRLVVSTVQNRRSTLRGLDAPAPAPADGPRPAPETPPALLSLEKMAYVDAVLWIGARLAEGLHHAHERGILHLDLKPANVLLTDDGNPMLLDFNLAEEVDARKNAAVRAHVGGTLPYMAPEQMRAFNGGPTEFDARTDVYSLGLILHQLLTGRAVFPAHRGSAQEVIGPMLEDRLIGAPRLRPLNPSITPAVEAIILRCLEPDPARRYQSAQELAEDIERHRADKPLLHTPEPCLRERLAKWARRNPRLTSPWAIGGMLISLILSLAALTAYVSFQRAQRELHGHYEHAVATYAQFSDRSHQAGQLLASDDPQHVAEGARRGAEALAMYGVLEDDGWKGRLEVRHLPREDRERLDGDVGELAFLMCRAEMMAAAPQEAQRLHALAAAQLGDDAKAALAVQRDHLDGVERAAAEAKTPRSAYLLASQHTARGRYHAALPLLEDVVLRSPKSVGAWFLKARCHHALGQPAEAVACYGTCIALRPTFAQAYFARAAMNYSLGRNLKQALADLNEALRLDPEYLDARIERALVLHAMKQDKEALPDLDLVLRRPLCPSRVYFIRSEVRRRLGDEEGAAADRAKGLKEPPTDAESWVTRGMMLMEKDPDAALRDFQRAEKLHPRMIEALINQAYVLGEVQKRTDDTLAVLDRFIRLHPDHVGGRGARAVLLARMGLGDAALAEARRCLALSSTPETQYRAACIYALASDGKPERLKAAQKHLATALWAGFGYEYVRQDPDLEALRRDPTFETVLESVKGLEAWKTGR